MVIFQDISHQLNMLLELPVNSEEFAPILQRFKQRQSIREHLTGVNAISCIQKPLIALITTSESVTK